MAGLVLAAGSGTRYGQPKAPVVIDGERLVDRAARLLREAGCDPVVVVLGAWVGDVPDAEVALNADWAEGMGSSLRVGLTALEKRAEVDRAVITLVDLPGLTAEAPVLRDLIGRISDIGRIIEEKETAFRKLGGKESDLNDGANV